MLRSDLCDYSVAYFFIKETITVEGTNDANEGNTKLTVKINAPFRSCISKINNTLTDNVEYLDTVMPMYHLLEYNLNYSETTDGLWFYSKDEATDFDADIVKIIILF